MANHNNGKKELIQAPAVEDSSDEMLVADNDLPAKFFLNPLANISFEQSYNPEILAEAIYNNVSAAILTSYGLRGTNIALQITSLSKGGLLVTFQESQYELVKTTDGILKAMTRGEHGQIHEIGAIDIFGNCINGLARSGAITVAVANIISNADLSKRLGEVQTGIDKLLEYRQIDTTASIKTEYESLREELGRGELRVREITNIRKEFRKNRHRLFGEVVYENQRIQSLLVSHNKKLKILKLKHKWGVEIEAKKAISSIFSKIRQALYCLQMENIAAIYSDDSESQDEFNADARGQLENIASQLSKWEWLEQSIEHFIPNSKTPIMYLAEPKSEYLNRRPIYSSLLRISGILQTNE